MAVGATYVLLYFVAFKIFSDANIKAVKPLALSFAIWAFFYRPLLSALIYEFHPSTVATPLVAGAILALLYKRDLVLWILVAVLLLSKENAPLAVLGLGCYAAIVLARRRLGLVLAGVAAVSAILVMGVIMPHFRIGAWHHLQRLGPLADWHRKSIYLFRLVAGLVFLPLASWRGLLCAAPLIALNLSVRYAPQYSSHYQYDDFASVFLLVAAMHGAVNVLRIAAPALIGRDLSAGYAAVTLAAALFMTLTSRGAPYYLHQPWLGAQARQLRKELADYGRLHSNVGIAAEQVIGPYLSFRQRYQSIISILLPDIRRLKPGDKILITPIRDPAYFSKLKEGLDKDAALTVVHQSSVLRVYQVKASNSRGANEK